MRVSSGSDLSSVILWARRLASGWPGWNGTKVTDDEELEEAGDPVSRESIGEGEGSVSLVTLSEALGKEEKDGLPSEPAYGRGQTGCLAEGLV